MQISPELMLGTARSQGEENTRSQPTRKARTIIRSVLTRVWISLARCKSTEAGVVWVRDTQAGAEGNREDSDYEKLQALPESDSVKPT